MASTRNGVRETAPTETAPTETTASQAAQHAVAEATAAPDDTHHEIAIVGAGFAGLGMAIRLKQAGREDFVIYERHTDIGGTWHVNTYPGCQCDIPSHLYSFSFAPNPNWARTYPEQQELWQYLRECADRFDLRRHLRLGYELTRATWDEPHCLWRLRTPRGSYTARVLIAAQGGLSEPALPKLPGLEDFTGTSFHTARWNHDHALAGRRIAVIGSGASAIQVVPQLQQDAAHLTVLQRTPPWIMPHPDRAITNFERSLYRRVPALQRLVRYMTYWSRELLVPAFVRRAALMKVLERRSRRHLARQVKDPSLREALLPSYRLGCKRLLPSNRWYPALQQPNVTLVTQAAREVRPDGIVDVSGALHEVDTIVFATGFHISDIRLAERIHGVDGRLLAAVWDGSPQGYLGAAVAGFPNLFFLSGPNTGLGHTSLVFMIESLINYVGDALRTMREHEAPRMEVRPAVQDAYNAELQRRMPATVWNSGGCSSWYIDANGLNTTAWPDYTWRFRRRTRRVRPADYHLTSEPGHSAPSVDARARGSAEPAAVGGDGR